MRATNLVATLAAVGCLFFAAAASRAAVIAADDFESYSSYSYGSNGGTGLGPASYLEGTGGGVFLSTDGAHIDGANSVGLYSSTGGQAFDRTITSPVTNGEYTVSARFNLDNSVSFSGFNLKSAAGSTFGDSELLSFGLTPGSGNDAIFVGGAANTTINLGSEIRGAVIDFDVIYDSTAGTFDIGAKFRADSTFTRVTGSLKATGQTPSVLAFGNFNNGNDQNLIIDNIQVQSVPEPASLGILAIAAAGLLKRRRA
jgi:hypothetical protein